MNLCNCKPQPRRFLFDPPADDRLYWWRCWLRWRYAPGDLSEPVQVYSAVTCGLCRKTYLTPWAAEALSLGMSALLTPIVEQLK